MSHDTATYVAVAAVLIVLIIVAFFSVGYGVYWARVHGLGTANYSIRNLPRMLYADSITRHVFAANALGSFCLCIGLNITIGVMLDWSFRGRETYIILTALILGILATHASIAWSLKSDGDAQTN